MHRRLTYISAGLALAELLITIAILAALAGLAAPWMTHLLPQNRLKGAAENIAQYLHIARSEAIRQTTPITLVTRTGPNWCFGLTRTADCDCTITNSCELAHIHSSQFPTVSLLTNFNNHRLSWDPVRALPNQAGEITLTARERTVKVLINQVGRIKLCSDTLKEYAACP